MSFNDFVVVFVKGNDYRIHFLYTSKDEAIKYNEKFGFFQNHFLIL